MPYNANPRMPKTCDGCIYQAESSGSYKTCSYIIETGQKRPCPPENCTVYQSEKPVFSNRLPDDVISEMRRLRKAGMLIKDIADKLGYSEQSVSKYVKCVDVEIDRSRISREQRDDIIRRKKEGQTVLQIAKETGISHTTIIRYTSENPAAAATTAGEESANQEKLSETIVSPITENVKPHEEAAETPSESEDKPDVKTYEDSPETSADEDTEGTAKKSVPPAAVEACLARIEHLRSEIDKEMVVVRNWEQEIKELREFLGLEEWE